MKTLNEKAMRALENSIPELASGAVKQAYVRALAAGSCWAWGQLGSESIQFDENRL